MGTDITKLSNVLRYPHAASFFERGAGIPEYFNLRLGWVPDEALYSYKYSGEIKESHEIPEEVAEVLIKKLNENYER